MQKSKKVKIASTPLPGLSTVNVYLFENVSLHHSHLWIDKQNLRSPVLNYFGDFNVPILSGDGSFSILFGCSNGQTNIANPTFESFVCRQPC
jgi:hypothetical protein